MEGVGRQGRAAQLGPIKPTLNKPGTKSLKLKYDEPPSNFAFNCNLRHSNKAVSVYHEATVAGVQPRLATFSAMLACLRPPTLPAGAHTRPLVSSTGAVSDTEYTLRTRHTP